MVLERINQSRHFTNSVVLAYINGNIIVMVDFALLALCAVNRGFPTQLMKNFDGSFVVGLGNLLKI